MNSKVALKGCSASICLAWCMIAAQAADAQAAPQAPDTQATPQVADAQAAPPAAGAQAAPQQAASAPAAPQAANAQPSPQAAVEEVKGISDIVVTAERRETSLQKTPMAVSVLNGDSLAAKQVSSVLDLVGALPSVQIGVSTGQARINVRGIGFGTLRPGDEGRVAYHVDGVYVARPSAQLGTFFDIERIELLRGPQGTLYGRNATAGAFNVITRAPTRDFSGYVDLTAGNYHLLQAEGALSGPLTQNLFARVAFQVVNRGGYGKNVVSGTPVNDAATQSIRLKLLWQPTADLDINFSGDYHRENDHNYQLLQFGEGVPGVHYLRPVTTWSQNISANPDGSNMRDSTGLSLDATYRVDEHLTAKALVAYRRSYYRFFSSSTGYAVPFNMADFREPSKQTTQELQLLGQWDNFHFVAGLYRFTEDESPIGITHAFGPTNTGPSWLQGRAFHAQLKTHALAAYGQFTYDITDGLSLTLGARYNREKKEDFNDSADADFVTPWPAPGVPGGNTPMPPTAGFPIPYQTATFNSFTPKVTIDYKITPNVLAYATYSTGLKSGGYNYGAIQPAYSPEKIKNYEGGLKTSWFDRRLILNLAGYYYDYSDVQVSLVQISPPGVFTKNAGAARVYGFELEATAKPTPNLQFDGAFSALHSKLVGGTMSVDPNRPALGLLNLNGLKLPGAPSYTYNAGVEYSGDIGPGRISVRGEVQGLGKTYFNLFNAPAASQDPYALFNAFINFTSSDEHWTAGAFVRNIGNKLAITQAFLQGNAQGGGVSGSGTAPRTFGLKLGYKW